MSEIKLRPLPEEPAHPHHFDFRTLYHILLERIWLVAICLVVAIFLTAAYLQRAPRLYSSTTTLQVEQGEEKVVNIQKVQQEDMRGLEILRTIEQTLQSRTLLERVIDSNNLGKDPRFISQLAEAPSREQLILALGKMVDVKLRRFTRLIDVTAIHTNPDIAALIANSLVKEYMRRNLEQYSASSDVASDFLLDEAQRLKKKLQESENALQKYREETKSVSLEQRNDIMGPKLKELSLRLTEAKSARIKLEINYAQIQELGTNVQALLVLPMVASDPTVLTVQNKLSEAETIFANLRQRYKEKHPKYLQAASQLDEWKTTFNNAVLKVGQTVKASYESAKAAEKALEQAVQEQESASNDLSKKLIQYNVLAREVESDRALYDTVFHRLKETSLTKQLPTSTVRTIQPATPAERPFSPNTKKILILGIFAGLVGGIGLALGLNALDSSIKTVDQAEEQLHMPVLSAVPQIKDKKDETSVIIVEEDAKSAGAEAFRSLRTSLTMLGKEEKRRTFLFTSALPQEGKTFCSVNYTASLAQQGLRSLLIDGDLRRPAVELAILGKRTKNIGVTDFLTGQKKFDEIIQGTNHENFSYISAGTTAPNPAELLAQGNFSELIKIALLKFDRVVVDSAPIHAVSDTLLMLDGIQTVCVVVRACKTPQKAVNRSLQMLQKAKAPLGGVILNRLPRRQGRGYYYDPYYDYSYHGSYGEKGVYGAEK